jgi:hypothetical protein
VVAGRAEALARLTPLIEAHRARRPVRILGPEYAPSDLDGAAAVLVVGDARLSPRRALPGVFLRASNGRHVPAGWLPDAGKRLQTYALAAAEVQRRSARDARRGPFVFLNERDERAMSAVDQVVAAMPDRERAFRWTSERISRPDLIRALQGGQGAAFYFGRGAARGLAGYGGFTKSDAHLASGHALGSLLCLTCSVSSRPHHGLSFCEEAVLSGMCAASLGATGETLHQVNLQLGLAFAQALHSPAITTLSGLLLSSCVPAALLNRYRIVGDPLAKLVGHQDSLQRAERVFAPAPDGELPIIPLASWGEEASDFSKSKSQIRNC